MVAGTEASDNVAPIRENAAGLVVPAPEMTPASTGGEVPNLEPPKRGRNGAKAKSESESYESRDLDGESVANDHDRLETLRAHVHKAEKLLLWVAVVLLALGMIVWSMHQLMPARWAWLNAEQLQTIQYILTTVTVSGLVGGLVRRVMSVPTGRGSTPGDF